MKIGETCIKLDHVSKKYHRATKSLRESIYSTSKRLISRLRQPDPHIDDKDYFWVLRDVSFEIKKGEALGIIGHNGAGKSTILKLLAGVTRPTEGNVTIRGRVAPLIEVGAGFHPDLTGRENIYLNGVILGLKKREIDKKFDSIIAFSELWDFIDTPVKYYSSGMYMRLGFSVAVHTEPDILLVDEVLAVGDLVFQRKCLDKIKQLLSEGTTIVLVSHDFFSIHTTCKRAIYLRDSQIAAEGETNQVIWSYEHHILKEGKNNAGNNSAVQSSHSCFGTGEAKITRVQFLDENGKERNEILNTEKVKVKVSYIAYKILENINFTFNIIRDDGTLCCMERTRYNDIKIDSIEGEGWFEVEFERLQLKKGVYIFGAVIQGEHLSIPYDSRIVDQFIVEDDLTARLGEGVFSPVFRWEIPNIKNR